MAKRKRDVPVLFWVSAEELELIHQKMQQYGTENLSAYLRKMAVGRLCGAAGFAGTERTGIPAAPEQQQLKPADPQGA
mgnify:CR=1 FL=1